MPEKTMEQEYRDEIIIMIREVNNLTFLRQIYTLVKQHRELGGD